MESHVDAQASLDMAGDPSLQLFDDELPFPETIAVKNESMEEAIEAGEDERLLYVEDVSLEKLQGEEVTAELEQSILKELESLPGGAVSLPVEGISVDNVNMPEGGELSMTVAEPVQGGGAELLSLSSQEDLNEVPGSVEIQLEARNESGVGKENEISSVEIPASEGDVPVKQDEGLRDEEMSSDEDEDVKFSESGAKAKTSKELKVAEERNPAGGLRDVRRTVDDPTRMKTSLCSYFRKKGCRHGENCKYAHGESELQPRPDGTWDPTSERGKNPVAVEKEEDTGVEPEQPGLLKKCLVHVPRGWNRNKLETFLTGHSVPFATAKKRKALSYCFINFENAEQVATSAEILDGMTLENKRLKFADVVPRSWERKAVGVTEAALVDANEQNAIGEDTVMHEDCLEEDAEGANGKKVLEPYRDVCQVVTPFAHLSYESQLNTKKDNITQVLKRLARNIRKGCPSGILLPDWLAAAKDREGLPCEFEGVLPSPVVDGYRNKCEFSIGPGPDGKRVVGFQLGTFREGVNAVAEPGNCRNVSPIALAYVAAFQTFIRSSTLPVWLKQDNTGFWRMLTIREGRKPVNTDTLSAEVSTEIAEVMLVVQVCPTGVPEERRAKEYTQMAKDLIETATTANPPLPLTALLVQDILAKKQSINDIFWRPLFTGMEFCTNTNFQDHVGVSNAAPPDCPLHALPLPGLDGNELSKDKTPVAHIHDYIGDLRFQISPTAFFQVNSTGAERLYTLAGDWASLGPDTLLFDVCCGTGTIGLTLAKRVGLVVGIEMNASAVADAQLNAELNGISNCRFVCGKAEDVINNLLKEYAVEESDDLEERADIPEPTEAPPTEGTELTTETGASEPTRDDQVQSLVVGEGKPEVREKARYTNIVAIVDPPRVGLHHVVLRTLRLHKQLRRLVYISCNPESLLANAVELCMPLQEGAAEKVKGRGGYRSTNLGHARRRVKTLPASEPFRPVKAAAVDLFPHTKHCEVVMLFER